MVELVTGKIFTILRVGTFFVNYQVRETKTAKIIKTLQNLIESRAYVSSFKQGWVSVYDEFSDQQNEQELHRLAKDLSGHLATDVLAFLVHDSDILIYLIYKQGKLVDEYNSRSDYWEKVSSTTRNRLKGKSKALLPYCKLGTSSQEIVDILNKKYTFEEDKLIELAALLNIDQERICLDFASIEQGILEEEEPENFKLVSRFGLASIEQKSQPLFEIANIYQPFFGCNLEALQKVLTEGTDVGSRSEFQNNQSFIDSSLIQSVTDGNLQRVEEWLIAGANVNATNKQGHATALAIAASRGDLAMVEILLQAEAQVNPHVETTTINVSESMPKNFFVGFLGTLAENMMSELVAQFPVKISPLWCAADAGHLVVVERLLKAGAKVNCDQQSALNPAVSGGHLDVVRALIKAGANVDQDLGGGFTLLMLAASMGYLGIVQVLMEAGADVKKQDIRGWTALDYAEQNNHKQVVGILCSS
ncbi:MAG: ankyrin repeat domain-containing protein [Pseudanabaena sp.]